MAATFSKTLPLSSERILSTHVTFGAQSLPLSQSPSSNNGCCASPSLSSSSFLPESSRLLLQKNCAQRLSRKSCFVKSKAAVASVEVSSSQSVSGRFAEVKAKGEVALIPFVMAGDPDLETTEKLLLALDANGADIIELGVPYSDPLADGPVIQAAATRALSNGTDLASVISLVTKVAPRLSAPLVLFTYYNPIMKKGLDAFFKMTKEAGAAALVIPDIPLEETPPLREAAAKYGLEIILLTTPTTPVERMKLIAEASEGFLYLVSLTGVTGARVSVESRVEKLLKEVKSQTDKPVAVGFGISTPAHAQQVVEWGADGVIVGSKIVGLMGNSESPDNGIQDVVDLMKAMKQALQRDVLVS